MASHCYFICLLAAIASPLAAQDHNPLVFRDTADESGLLSVVKGMRGHGAGWGDVDGDGWLDLYVGTFHTEGPANLLLRNVEGRFRLDRQPSVQISTRATGVVFADFDNDGDLDLYVASMPAPEGSRLSKRIGRALAGCSLFRNDGAGQFSNVSSDNGACPTEFGGRSATVLDFDGDGLLDLVVGEDPLPGYNGSSTKSSRMFRNEGDLRFRDISRQVQMPEGIPGLGVAAADVNQDGWPDVFLAANNGGNRLLLNENGERLREAPGTRETFAWPTAGGDNMVCGVAFGDVNRDGLLDVVLGQHYERPWREPVANRLYLNRGINDGVPSYEDVTDKCGLAPLAMKAPHVEIQDFDNDGWPDLSTSFVKFAAGTPHPVIFRHQGLRDGLPHFHAEALQVNSFPTDDDRAITRSQELFDKTIRERTVLYTAPGPSGDYDNDGRLDLFLASWWTDAPSLLLRNETKSGHWLDIQLVGARQVNRQGIGCRILIYPAGQLHDRSALLGCREMSVGYGYASGQPAIAHFGLGTVDRVDCEIELPHGRGQVTKNNVPANQRLTIPVEPMGRRDFP